MGVHKLAIVCRSRRRPSHAHGRASVTSFLTLVLILGLQTAFLSNFSECAKIFDLYWNTTNPIFERNKDRNIFVVNCGNKPHEFDQVNIFCPFYKNDTPRNAETYAIYSATKEEYDTCRKKSTRPSYPLVCNKPGAKVFYTVTFRQYSPQPHGLEFRPGEDHYFVSTEHNNNTDNGGPCVRTNNVTMRMVIRVCCRNESCKSSSTTERPQNLPGPISMTPTTRAPQVLSSSSTPLPPLLPPLRPMPPKEVPEITSHGKSSNKKSSEYDKHPNEVVKNEELTYNSAPPSLRVRWWCPQFVLPGILVLVWRFRIDRTDNLIDVNIGNTPFEYDQVNMVCPVYKPGTHVEDLEKYIIYNVSKEEYYLCRITNSNPRIVAVCDKPYKLMFFTVTFRPFTPQPGGLEFHPGQDYYFISTSSKDDLHRRIGGRCSTDNLKVVFKVCCRSNEQYSNSTGLISHPQHIPGPSRRTTPIPTTSAPMMSSSTSIMAPTSAVPSPQPVPPRELPEIPTHSKPANKKSSDFDKRPNEVVKNEELTHNSAWSSLRVRWWSQLSVIPAILVLMYLRR